MEETEKRPMIIAEVPRQKHWAICDVCKTGFITRYSYQKYCKQPCTHKDKYKPEPKPKKPKEENQTPAEARKKIKDKAEKKRKDSLNNRKWLSMKL